MKFGWRCCSSGKQIKASESGRKGGKGARKHEVKDHVINWFSKDGYKIRNNKSAALDYLLNHWEDFCHGLMTRPLTLSAKLHPLAEALGRFKFLGENS